MLLWNRDGHWTGIGLGPTLTNFVEFKLRPECELFHNLRIRTGIGLG